MGDAYWQVGRKLEAKFQWRRSLSLEPEEDLDAKIRKKLKFGLGVFKSEEKQQNFEKDSAGEAAPPVQNKI